MKKIIFLSSFCFFLQFSIAQTTNYWIILKDKKDTPYSIHKPSEFLSEKAIARRVKQHIAINESDLPVNPSYLYTIQTAGVKILNVSKWMNAVSVTTTDVSKVERIKTLSFVKEVIEISINNKLDHKFDREQTTEVTTEKSTLKSASDLLNYGISSNQSRQIGVNCLHNAGYQGQGMTIAVFDVGFFKVDSLPAFDTIRANGQILGTHDFVAGGTSVYEDPTHGMNTLSCMGGNLPGRLVGTAPKAKFWS
jgi:hypothetical protein